MEEADAEEGRACIVASVTTHATHIYSTYIPSICMRRSWRKTNGRLWDGKGAKVPKYVPRSAQVAVIMDGKLHI